MFRSIYQSGKLSQKQLTPDFAVILQETGTDSARIVLEITGTALMLDME